MKLSEVEKKEMLEDGKDKKRMMDFRKASSSERKMSFEEYIAWLTEMQELNPVKTEKKFIAYKNVKI